MARDNSDDNKSTESRLKPVRKRSLSDAVFEQLREEIVSGRMEPGSTLPAERTLSDMLNVNRGAIREALKRLEQARLVTIQHGGATRVLNFLETAGTDLLSQLLIRANGTVDPRVARGVMEMRTTIGTDLARLCAERADDELVARLRQALDDMNQAGDDLARVQSLSMDFWGVMIDGADNVAYQLAFNSLRQTYDRVHDLLTEILLDELSALDAYHAMVDAIERSDPDDAQEQARGLLELGEQRVADLVVALEAEQAEGG